MTLTVVILSSSALFAAERVVIGLTSTGQEIEAWSSQPALAPGQAQPPTLIVIAGLHGRDMFAEGVRKLVDIADGKRILTIPVANPDGETLVFPPTGNAYGNNRVSHFLWRWIALQGPDEVIINGNVADEPLIAALQTNTIAGIAPIQVRYANEVLSTSQWLSEQADSAARVELNRRRSRTAQQVATEFAAIYGHDFDQLTYLPGMALIGQLRLGNIDEVSRLAEPYLNPDRDVLERASSLTLAGHLVFAELADRLPEGNLRNRYVDMVKRVGDLGFDENGTMLESMPFHGEMSDSYFMAGPIVAKAGKFSGNRKYFDLAAQHFRFLRQLTLREDGLHRHSPLTDAAWGRGNAFPALGLALTLSEFPEDHPDYAFILQAFRDHMETLARFQDAEGMWHNVIDMPGSYAETSATSMIATAMLRGVTRGWLDAAEYRPRVDRAWNAVLTRLSPDGSLIDVCESTNKQTSLQAYLDRTALLGLDPRGGGMALLFAAEMLDASTLR